MWEVTVLYGKQSIRVPLPPLGTSDPSDTAWLETLHATLAQETGVATTHQKLLFRGKQLTHARGTELTNGAKLMLLKNAAFHKREASRTKPANVSDAGSDSAVKDVAAAPAPDRSQRLDIDVSDIDDDHVLVQAARGKAVFEFLFPVATTIASVKNRIGDALGLSGAALRLLLKGKTPMDDDVLARYTAAAGPRVLKCMVLLQAKQHDLMEREDEFRVLLNELTSVETDVQKLAKVMFRNVLAREEVLFRLHALQDHVSRVQSNLAILDEQLKATKLVQGSTTLKALENAQHECDALTSRIEALAKQFESGR